MSQQATLAKRQHEESGINDDRRSKMQKRSESDDPSPSTGSNLSRLMRVLLPASRLESIIGEDGRAISKIQEETGARLHVEDPFPGCNERVIAIGGLDLSGSNKGSATPSIQKALLLLFDRMVVASSYVVRLLVPSTQAGLPPSTIKRISSESGARILILGDEQLPSCASPSDELVQISGEAAAVRRALQPVSLRRLLEDSLPARESDGRCPPPYIRFRDDSLPYFTLSYRMLCSEEKVGGVMGKRGNRIQRLQDETGCKVEALDGGKGDNRAERIFFISGPAHPNEGITAPQDAVVRPQSRIFRSHPVSTERTLTAKLLVPAHQMGCLLGHRGSVMAEMKRETGAHIRILSKNLVPKHASENDEVVQIDGTANAIREALIHITSRLRNRFFREALRYHVPAPPSQALLPPPPPVLPPHTGPQGPHQQAARPMGFPVRQSAPPRPTGGNLLVTSTSRKVEVAVPCSIVPAIEEGFLEQIQEFSDATILIMDREPGANVRMVVIRDTPEQTIAARSLVCAFVMSEREAR